MEYREYIQMNLKMWEMVDYIRDSGIRKLAREMEWAYSSGRMAANMKACGKEIKLMEEVE